MKKKILIVVPSLMFGAGAEKVASLLSLNLSEQYDISIIAFFHYKEIYPFKGKYYTLKERQVFSRFFLRCFKLHKNIKAIQPDIIITFMNSSSFWIIILKYLSKVVAPLIISVNTNPDFHYRKRVYGKFLIRFLYSLRKVNMIVPVSKELKNIFVNKYKLSMDKVKPIYNGFDIEKIQLLAKENIEDFNSQFSDRNLIKFITIGRLSKEKGHKYLIKAFSEVYQELPNARLFIIGAGILRSKLMKLIKDQELENKVFLLGTKKNPYKYLSKADIFVLSSLHEGLPTVLIEALVCHLPIISTNCKTGPKEILEDGRYGILTNVADSNDLAKKMILLAKNKDVRQNFARKSIERIEAFEMRNFKFNWIKLINDSLKKRD